MNMNPMDIRCRVWCSGMFIPEPNTIPLQQNEAGVALVSGFNPTVYQMVLSDELDPYRCLLQQLNAKRYDAVEQALGEKRG